MDHRYASTAQCASLFSLLIAFVGYNPLPDPKTDGQAVGRSRQSLGLSQQRLGDLAGVEEATVRRLEADTRGTARRVRQAIRTVLNSARAPCRPDN